MSTTEQIYALLIEANPVPDPDAQQQPSQFDTPPLRVLDPGRIPMQTQERVETATPKPPSRRWIPAAAAAVGVIVVVGVIALLSTQGEEQPAPVADEPALEMTTPEAEEQVDPGATREADAVGRVEAYHAALAAGDIEAIDALVQPNGSDLQMFEHNAVGAAAYPYELTGCDAVTAGNEVVVVECGLVMTDPVFVALEAERLVVPWWVYDDGRMQWRPFEGADPGEINSAYRDYLLLNDSDGYAEFCDPAAYGFAGINFNQGIAFTAECAELQAAVADDVAAWIEAGRPAS